VQRPSHTTATAPRFPVLHGRIHPDGTATLDGRAIATTDTDPEHAVLAEAAATARLYGRQLRLQLTDPTGRVRDLVVYPHGPTYPQAPRRGRHGVRT